MGGKGQQEVGEAGKGTSALYLPVPVFGHLSRREVTRPQESLGPRCRDRGQARIPPRTEPRPDTLTGGAGRGCHLEATGSPVQEIWLSDTLKPR